MSETHPPTDLPPPPMSVAAAVAVLDVSDRPARPARAERKSVADRTSPPVEPPPAVVKRGPGAPLGVVRKARRGRRRVDIVVYDGVIVLAKPGRDGRGLTAGQLAALDPAHRIVNDDAVSDVVVSEDRFSGKARIGLRTGKRLTLSWRVPGRNAGVAVENLMTSAFPGKVDHAPVDMGGRVLKAGFAVFLLGALVFGASTGLAILLAEEPPPPPPPPPPVTVPPAELAARTELNSACPPWLDFAASVPSGDRPPPAAMRPIVDGIRPRFNAAAAAAPAYALARDEVGYLQDYSRRTPEAVANESVARVGFAMEQVTKACEQARS